MEARKSGDLASISEASGQVIALGLAELAKLRLDERKFEEAVKLCRASLQYEDTPETRVELAIVSLYDRKPAEAVEQASLAAEREPQNALAWNIKGQALLNSEDFAAAEKALERSLELHRDADAIYALGIAHLGLGEKQKAADTFSQMLKFTGDYGWSRVLVGRAYAEQRLAEEANQEFQNALRIDPLTPNAHYYWALTLLQANAWSPTPEVLSHLHEELKIDPRHFLANYWLGYFAWKERNYDQSDHYLKLAAAENPSQPEVWMFLGLNAQNRAANQSAETYFRKALALTESMDAREHLAMRRAYFALGRILVSSGREREGQDFVRKAKEFELQVMAESQKRPGITDEKDGSGMSQTDTPDVPTPPNESTFPLSAGQGFRGGEGSQLTQRPLTKSLQNPAGKTEKHLRAILGSAFNDLATAEALQEKYDLAAKHYREAEGWDPGIPGVRRNLGLAAYFVGEHAEAIRLLAKVVRATPGDAHARAVLGLAYFATRDYAKAVPTISPIANQALQDPQLGFAWAKSLAETGNKIEATRALQSLDKSDANLSSESLIQFGKLWQELGDTQRAAQFFRRALAIDPENADAKCALHLSECP